MIMKEKGKSYPTTTFIIDENEEIPGGTINGYEQARTIP
jgi:hypothetical protein